MDINIKIKENIKLLPSVDQIISSPFLDTFSQEVPREILKEAIRQSIKIERNKILGGIFSRSRDDIINRIVKGLNFLIEKITAPSLKKIINATGIMIHTNLGRAVISQDVISRVSLICTSFSNLEFDLKKGKRGKRESHLKKHLRDLTGAEDSLVVNNNAAAVLLVLDTFAKGKEVIVSRGELIEIGGSFRLPSVFEKSSAILKEVGCTNKTHFFDYEDNINENTSMLLKCHTSNYSIEGFTEEVSGEEISQLGKKYNLITAEDLGSGLLLDLSRYGLHNEKTVMQKVKSGIDIITFSGDKLLGGPQAGIIIGKSHLIKKMEKNPLARALRIGKMTIGALEATLELYRDPDNIEKSLPLLKMLSQSDIKIKNRILKIFSRLRAVLGEINNISVIPGYSKVGGGSCPSAVIKTYLIAIDIPNTTPGKVYDFFINQKIPIVTRIYKDKTVLDLRTINEQEEETVFKSLLSLLKIHAF